MGRQILFLLTFYMCKQTWPHLFCLLLQFKKKNYILNVHSYQIKKASCKLGEKNDRIAKLREEVIYRFDYSFVLKKI